MVAPQAKKACVHMLMQEHVLSERHACRLVGANRATVRYQAQKAPEEKLKEQIREIAMKHKRYGYRRVHQLLIRAGRDQSQESLSDLQRARLESAEARIDSLSR